MAYASAPRTSSSCVSGDASEITRELFPCRVGLRQAPARARRRTRLLLVASAKHVDVDVTAHLTACRRAASGRTPG